ncbi:unnamed protein product [Dovyalis caffra]|uniref:Uncharacterized protein n=1 Tax=Dovyalis caffra TaxID=77055 RepID=A0AAV1S347_9ROSI|nr:unnamed protein product [Dovyalis caffra]
MGSNNWIARAMRKRAKVSKKQLIRIFALISGGSSIFASARALLLTVITIKTAQHFWKCTCDAGEEEEEESNESEALKYKAAAIASILFAGVLGVGLPILGKTIPALSPEKNIFFIIKAFAAGVILSTGFIHVLPDAFESLTSPCLNENPWGKFPFTAFVAMVSAIGTLMVDCLGSSYFTRLHLNKAQPEENGDEEKAAVESHEGYVHLHTHATHGHSLGPIDSSGSCAALEGT